MGNTNGTMSNGFYTPTVSTPPPSSDKHNNGTPTNVAACVSDISDILSEIAAEIDHDYEQTDVKPSEYSSISLSFVPRQNHVTKITEIFNYKQQLGNGASCRVLLATKKSNNINYALKEMQQHKDINRLFFATEYKILTKLQHKNMLSLDSCYIDKNCYYLCFPYHSGGTMLDRILEKGTFCELECAEFIKNVLNGLKYMHDNNTVHRDIKLDNLIFDKKGKDGIVKIIDFGNSEIITNPHKIDNNIIGSVHYLPPELLLSKKRTKQMLYKGDIWALGVVCYVLVTGKLPFHGTNQFEILNTIRAGKFNWPSDINLSDSCRDFISSLLCVDINKRFDCNLALTHEWISKKGKAVDTLFGDKYFNAIEIFSKTNKLEKILINAVLSEMDIKQKHILLRAIRDLNINGNNEINQNHIINYILMQNECNKSENKVGLSATDIENVLNEIDKMDQDILESEYENDVFEYESDIENDDTMSEGEFIYIEIDEKVETEEIEKCKLDFYNFSSAYSYDTPDTLYTPDNCKISIKRFSAIISGANKKYDIKTLVDRLNPTKSGNIHLKNINGFNGPLHSIASNNKMMNDVMQIGLNINLSSDKDSISKLK